MLSRLQRENLAALADGVIPPDDFPGAVEAACVRFVERLLATDQRERSAHCMAFLDALGEGFARLRAADRDALLREREADPAFQTLAEMVHESYWTSPIGLHAVGFTVRG